ncbi:hypothetical protein EU527_01950 [Candidatus Thorarchaeota archaeon]|nr:MAG: hypothetical protein EU527_01950 [Candidatus Thorarchaeota archaeon]
MIVDDIEIIPIAAESMGVRSLCTFIRTPDISILLDPSAALARRFGLEPHPLEYKALQYSLSEIRAKAQEADILSLSHYHYDHVRPGFRNCLYNLSTHDERKEMFAGKYVLAKDNRENINNSQRRRAYFFQKEVKSICKKIDWCDGKHYEFGSTRIQYSPPLPHGSEGSPLGFVLATTIEFGNSKILFAPDVQGPIARSTLNYILTAEPDLVVVGGPPTYLKQFSEKESQSALYCLSNLVSVIPILVVDHHNLRDPSWKEWLSPITNIAIQSDNVVCSMAELIKRDELCLEANRNELYKNNPPTQEFTEWTNTSDEYKIENLPPI